MERPRWNDLFNVDELAAALRVHANHVAKLTGWYDKAQDILHAADCIEDLADKLDMCAGKAEELQATVEQIQRRAKAAVESLSALP